MKNVLKTFGHAWVKKYSHILVFGHIQKLTGTINDQSIRTLLENALLRVISVR